jgi:hypothetical protein
VTFADGQDDGGTLGALTPQQESAIIALLTEPTVPKAAEACGVPEHTLYRWMTEDTAFSAAYRKARREAFGQAVGLSQRLAPMAITTLAKVMSDAGASHSARVSAATNLLRFGREVIELEDIAARVEALERAAQEQQEAKPWQ